MTRGLLLVGNFLSGTGMHRHYCEDLADRLAATWHVTRTSHHRGRVARIVDMTRVTWSARRDYQVAQVDVFSGLGFVWAEAVCFELARLGKPFVLTLHGGNLPSFIERWPRRAARLFASAATVTAPSGFLHAIARDLARDAIVIPNAIDLARYPYTHRTTAPPRLIWLRAFHAIYNPLLAVDVLARVRADLPAATLEMIGPDKGDGSLQQVERRVVELGLSAHVKIVPGVPNLEVPARLAPHAIYLNTSDVDNSPVSVLEAMACGLCVVSTSVGGIRFLVEHERDGLVVPPRDADAMARAIARIVGEPGLAARLSANARRHAEVCDWPRVLAQWDEVLERAIS